MKRIVFIFISLLVIDHAYGQDGGRLYPVSEGNLWGYINRSGRTVIEPQFLAAGQFTEGLAPVRMNGTYGYINEQGEFVIPPKYDLALIFQNGIAKVYMEGKPFFIDKKGKIIFDHVYKTITVFGNDPVAIVTTMTDKYGVIDKTGKLVADTVFKKIQPFADGLAIVMGLNHSYSREGGPVFEMGVIDMKGNWIVKYGRYERIENYKNGYAKAELILTEDEQDEGWVDKVAVVDTKGQQRFVFPATKFHFEYGKEGFYDEVAIVSIYSVDVKTKKTWSSSERTDFKGVINTDGQILFSDRSWKEVTPFNHNRAFAQDVDENWKMIDKNGKQVGDLVFEEILYDTYRGDPENLFVNGKAFVLVKDGWAAIDTTGKLVSEPNHKMEDFDHRDLDRVGDIIFLTEDISVESEDYSYRYGFWDTRKNVIVKPTYHDIERKNFDDDLIYAMKDGKRYYITKAGKIIWQEEESETGAEETFLNIDHMNRGYYYAASKPQKELARFGGWGSSQNGSKQAMKEFTKEPYQSLQVFIDETEKVKWQEKYEGLKLYVVNTAKDTMFFEAQDSRLYLKLQAKDAHGNWKDIEYLPSSWCGNSYHMVFLANKEQWEFNMPVYKGEFKTMIRAQLLYKKDKNQEKSDIIYSNEIVGYINPGQFWNKRPYYPGGIMDPYND